MKVKHSVEILLALTLLIYLATMSQTGASSTATISGVIRHSGQPVAGISVSLHWEGGGKETATGPDGSYSVGGVPTGGWIQIFVRPPVAERLAFRNFGTTLHGDLVKDFDLVKGFRLQGEFHQPDGSSYKQNFWLETNPTDFSSPENEWIGDGANNGRFDLVIPPGKYLLNTNPRTSPLFMPSVKVDLQSQDVTGLVITLLDEPRPPLFQLPLPRADRIEVGQPDDDGFATVTGAAGAVEPYSEVAVVNVSAYTLATASAGADGAFVTQLFAPPGSSVLVKYDPDGDRIARLWKGAIGEELVADLSEVNPLPGTILYVGKPRPGENGIQEFHSVGAFRSEIPKGWAGWWLSGTMEVFDGDAGQQMQITANLRVTSKELNAQWLNSRSRPLMAHVGLRSLFGADGQAKPWGIWFNAHLFTPTGLPIEVESDGETRGVGSVEIANLRWVGSHTIEGTLNRTFEVPLHLTDGIFRPQIYIDGQGIALDKSMPMVMVWYSFDPIAVLPPFTLGSPASPHIPWTLLGDYPVNGHRGVQANEDVGYFTMPTRVLFPPHQAVIPRLNERTEKPIAYRLEPGSHWISASERRMPNPPHIPFAFPSGTLTVQVQKPDGSSDILGPATVSQSSIRTPTTPGGAPLSQGTGQISDLYHLTTMDNAFAYSFDQYGPHVITLSGEVEDIYGNSYPIEGTYEVTVARVLDLDPAQLPTTPYVVGDHFAPGLHLFPPFPAQVTVKLVHMPESDPEQALEHTITGKANRFGYFQPPPGEVIQMTAPGEFRVDISAVYEAEDGTLWKGIMTWGNVVEGVNAPIEAHGRRGMDYHTDRIDDMPVWFEVFNLPPEKVGIEVYYPYFSGDIHWGNEDKAPGDSIHPIISIRDRTPDQRFYNVLRQHWNRNRTGFRWPPDDISLPGLEKRIAVGEAPLFTTTASGVDPRVAPDQIDLWGYWYGSSERPDVRVREVISVDNMGTGYWRFDDTYTYQIGEGAMGDLPGDLKWEFGGAVFRLPGQDISEYAIYSSLWVLLPHNDPVGARVTPPFQDATGASINGGPIMTLGGEDIDMLFLPKGVRPGDVLEKDSVISFSGHVGPPLDSRVSVSITSPSGVVSQRTWHANKIGWIYDPSFDFIAQETGRWTVEVAVVHDRPYVGNGVIPTSHNTGTVLGTKGQYEFYVVSADSPRLEITSPSSGFLTWDTGHVEPITIRGNAPPETTTVHYTIHDKGVVMGQGSLKPDPNGAFELIYDAKALNQEFPFLSLTAHEGPWEGLADEVSIGFLATGGQEMANTVTLIGEEVFIGASAAPEPAAVSGIVVNADGPVAGATVRVRGTDNVTFTTTEGEFTLTSLVEGLEVEMTAWAKGYYIASTHVTPPADNVVFALRPYHTVDYPDYEWVSPLPEESTDACGNCHPMIVSQWQENAHGGAVSNPRFFSFYNGTDVSGTVEDGSGYLDDFPGTAGNCANCHAPGSGLDGYLTTNMSEVRGEVTAGIHCDFCHKIGGVYLNPATQSVYPNVPGTLSLRMLRPPEGDNIFFGPFDDIHDPDTFVPVISESAFCAPCHQFSFWGTPIYESYNEWLASPYADQGITCQNCHMPPTGDGFFALPEKGGLEHSPEQIPSHLQLGAMSVELLQDTVTMDLSAQPQAGNIKATVKITNAKAGHHVPTDHPGRHLILVVQATDSQGKPLQILDGPTIPEWGGAEAGLPGKAFAKVLRDVMSGDFPVVSYWKQALILSDNRIPALGTDVSNYTYALPADRGEVEIKATLIFRRLFQLMAEAKGWAVPDVLMEQVSVKVTTD